MLASLRDERGRSDGFLDRVLFAFPDARPAPEWTWDEVPEETLAPWVNALQQLLNLSQEPGAHGPRPRFVRLTLEARPEWQAIIDGLTREINREDFPPHLRGPWAKLKVYAARFALTVHLLRWVTREAEEQNVDDESMRRAGLLVNYFGSNARKAYAVMAADREFQDAKRVLAWVARERQTEFKRHEVWNDVKSQERFPRVEDLDRPLRRLVTHRFLRVRQEEKASKAGRPPEPTYEVNPLWDHQTNQTNQENPPPDGLEAEFV
jgi:hypothetical protein